MTETMDDERDARMTLAALSPPGDIVTGTLVAQFGATVVVEAGPAWTSGSNRSPPNEGSIHEHTATAGPLGDDSRMR